MLFIFAPNLKAVFFAWKRYVQQVYDHGHLHCLAAWSAAVQNEAKPSIFFFAASCFLHHLFSYFLTVSAQLHITAKKLCGAHSCFEFTGTVISSCLLDAVSLYWKQKTSSARITFSPVEEMIRCRRSHIMNLIWLPQTNGCYEYMRNDDGVEARGLLILSTCALCKRNLCKRNCCCAHRKIKIFSRQKIHTHRKTKQPIAIKHIHCRTNILLCSFTSDPFHSIPITANVNAVHRHSFVVVWWIIHYHSISGARSGDTNYHTTTMTLDWLLINEFGEMWL